MEADEEDLKNQILNPELREKPDFFKWLGEQIEKVQAMRKRKLAELESLEWQCKDIESKAGLGNLERTIQDFKARFNTLTPVEKRDLVEKIVRKKVVYKDNRVELVLRGDHLPLPSFPPSQRGKKIRHGLKMAGVTRNQRFRALAARFVLL